MRREPTEIEMLTVICESLTMRDAALAEMSERHSNEIAALRESVFYLYRQMQEIAFLLPREAKEALGKMSDRSKTKGGLDDVLDEARVSRGDL